jgi:2-keto-4-pentenoate hydratase/2-oxohepta-3-ene-1,7-dioic acid hydratase in catechol pathway
MRIAAVQTHEGRKLAVDVDGEHRRLELDRDLLSLIQRGVDPQELAVGAAVEGELAAPLQPGKIVGIGLNYLDHIRESKLPQPSRPLVFAKFPSSVTGPNDPIVVDLELTTHVDWEVELGVIVGRRMRRVDVAAALDHVFGYTACNDVSARDVQFSESQWTRGKSFDTFCPLGPVVVAFCSRNFTLEPGDLLLTGTPWGCGYFMDPPRALELGDVVECEVERIGVLRNTVAAAR